VRHAAGAAAPASRPVRRLRSADRARRRRAGAGAPRPVAAAAPAGKECGEAALVDDGEDGNNQAAPAAGRGGFWYTFKDAGSTTVEPQAGAYGGRPPSR